MNVVDSRQAGDERLRLIQRWLESAGVRADSIEPASSDASFRRYFRVQTPPGSRIVMDAPPPKEDTEPFVRVARLFAGAGIHVPEVVLADADNGFLLISDLGTRCYLGGLDESTAPGLYRDAMHAIGRLQQNIDVDTCELPAYDEALLRRELGLFEEWFVDRKLRLEWGGQRSAVLRRLQDLLVAAMLEQPRVCVHRDFHSRNLMICDTANPGVLDFQDAVVGPLCYDLVSLLRDCYVAWPVQQVDAWVRDFHGSYAPVGLDADRFIRWFDLTGMQRHMKAAGIFCRLQIRDGKNGYLSDIPRTVNYMVTVCARYPELQDFGRLLEGEILPAMNVEIGQ